jgi:2-amino-4-hydroxy-6-hydroxymethyldihydropteridine diphosphokinase
MGSNLGNRQQQLDRAAAELRREGVDVKRLSSVYETEPVGLPEQPWFLNVVAEAETELFPMQLLDRLQQIEIRLGRRRLVPQGPRTIDIDILLYGDFRIQTDRLTIPHPRLEQRRFVLEPLAELAPELRHPVSRCQVRELLAASQDRSLVRRVA